MARPFSPARHYDLIGRVVRRNERLCNHTEDAKEIATYKAIAKGAAAVGNYIKAKKYGEAISYMKRSAVGAQLQEQLPETFETLQNQHELVKAQKAEAKAA